MNQVSACKVNHSTAPNDELLWSTFKPLGVQMTRRSTLELKNCVCGTTLSRKIQHNQSKEP